MNTHANETEKKTSRELRAVLKIFNADEELRCKALPWVLINQEVINWDGIWKNDFGGGHSAALNFAQALWCDKVMTKADPFDNAFAMDSHLRLAVVEALAIRWGLMN